MSTYKKDNELYDLILEKEFDDMLNQARKKIKDIENKDKLKQKLQNKEKN